MYNDTVPTEILSNVDKSRNSHDNKSKSKWEKELNDLDGRLWDNGNPTAKGLHGR